jgi:hypothetical protein
LAKIAVIIEDDWELRGNGSGSVTELQYLPALFLMDCAERLGIKLTFMVEVLQQLKFLDFAKTSRYYSLQSQLWQDTVLEMSNRGFDVQLHLHPQWHSAYLDNGIPIVAQEWNLGRYKAQEQATMIETSLSYLNNLLKSSKNPNNILAFKAGNWGLQPSKTLLENIENNGIYWVLGVCRDIWIPQQGTDYREIDEDTLPYIPDFEDIRRVSDKNIKLRVIPMTYAYLSIHQAALVALSRIIRQITQRHIGYSLAKAGNEKYKGGTQRRIIRGLSLANHVQLGNLSYSAMKSMFDSAYKRLSSVDNNMAPIVIESHSKLFSGNYRNISKFLEYIVSRYESKIDFHDMTSFHQLGRSSQ